MSAGLPQVGKVALSFAYAWIEPVQESRSSSSVPPLPGPAPVTELASSPMAFVQPFPVLRNDVELSGVARTWSTPFVSTTSSALPGTGVACPNVPLVQAGAGS